MGVILVIKKKKKAKSKTKEPDLFTTAKERRSGKPKEWRYPLGVRYNDVLKGDIFIFEKARDWENKGKVAEFRGEVMEKGSIDAKTRYFIVKINHPERQGMDDEDIRRFIITKK